MKKLWTRGVGLFRLLWRELAKFGVVGGVAFLIDTAVFLWLITGPMDDSHVKSKAIAVAVATLFSWVGNRYWTFRHQRTRTRMRELVMFILMNVIGLLIMSGCVAFSFYVLGLRSEFASFVSGSIIGMGLAMVFRFIAYKYWVFTGEGDAETAKAAAHAAPYTGQIPALDTETASGETER
ncbi:GtrA family protein [Nesterenkonia sp. MY13]|uniref:GtrA family protein n=1 Tax=Nesterenkonia sedimenti TaxID=1463632 RepID=A0A7X8THR6_9MICC|nr:GtrA family protein [Nesterenkonia sedimenti]NLS08946.1 GtrA family protein [Nesterenkonia sedimenti]